MTDSAQNSKQILAQKGTAGTPSHSFLGGNTTGMYLAGTNQLGFSTAGAFAAVIDASGNVGIGVVPSAWSATSYALQVGVGASVFSNNVAYSYFGTNNYFDGTNWRYMGTGAAVQYVQSAGANIWNYAVSGTAGGALSWQEAMRISASGNVGIGTSSAPEKLSVNGNIYFTNSNPYIYGPGNLNIQCGANSATLFNYNAGSEAMRISTVGDLCIGTIGAFLSNTSSFAFSPYYNYSIFNKASTSPSGSYYIYFGYAGGAIGSVTQNGTTGVLFNTASDYRLKENVTPMTTGLATISALNPVTYNWVSDKSHGEGFIAHELQALIPGAVTGKKDDVDKDGKIKPQGVDYSKVVVHLVAAIQELAAKVAALEGK